MDFTSFSNIIDGKSRGAETSYHGINPATEEELFDVPVATEADLNDAVISARNIFPSWSQTPFEKRCELVRKYAAAYIAHEKDFTELLMKENGKPRTDANREIHSSYDGILEATKWKLPVETMEDDNKTATVRYVPLGIVGAICPWNFPLVLSFTKIAPALIAGNCVIVKPSPYTPYTTLKAVEVGHSIFPPGVLQVLGGDEKLGPWVVSHPDIQKISFTGSIPTGKKIMAECAKTLKRVTLELGGNDASIVCPDVDIENTASAVAMAAFKNSGQICVASKRIYIHEAIYKPFLEAMASFTESLKFGDPFDKDTKVGPIQNAMQYEKVQTFFADCKKKGYTFATDDSKMKAPSKGYFIQPTIIANPPNDSKIVTEEPFGPIIPVQPWSDEADVIRRTNHTKTGLGACIWSKDTERAERIARQLEVGSIYINSPLRPDWRVYFSGHKESGIGGERGLMGLLAYCNAQAIHVYK
jgi:acyl-CoA reductase-like NAD-dependent aldehyde dehydrogenase